MGRITWYQQITFMIINYMNNFVRNLEEPEQLPSLIKKTPDYEGQAPGVMFDLSCWLFGLRTTASSLVGHPDTEHGCMYREHCSYPRERVAFRSMQC